MARANTRIQLEGDRAAAQSQWSVIHRIRSEQGFTDFWHQGRRLEVFEKRDGEWKILHRVMSSEFDRGSETLDVASIMAAEAAESDPMRSCRGPSDPSFKGSR